MKKKPFIVANVRDILDLYDKEEISFSKMVEMFNDVAEKFYEAKEINDCSNCRHIEVCIDAEPCFSCQKEMYRNWEPQ